MEILRNLGYITVTNPSENIKPLQLLFRSNDNSVEALNAKLTDLFISRDVAIPKASANVNLSNSLKAKQIIDLNAEGNLNLVFALLNKVSAGLTIDKKTFAEVSFENLVKNIVNLISLEAYLRDACLNESAKFFLNKLEKGEIYIITEILKTKKFNINLSNDLKTGSKQGISVQRDLAHIAVEVESNKDIATCMEYKGNDYLVVGIKAFKIHYVKPSLFSSKEPYFKIVQNTNTTRYKSDEEIEATSLKIDYITL